MARKKRKTEPTPLEAPNAGELDVYSVLWAERCGDNHPLQLSEVHRRVCQRRRGFGEPEPALTTVSTHLRGLVRKELADEVHATRTSAPPPSARSRGSYTPPTRSPLTGYRARHAPGEVLLTTFRGLAAAYPEGQRLEALLDFARALDLSAEGMRQLRELIDAEHARAGRQEGKGEGESDRS
jgi:predicted transcriptional regulator